MTAEKYRNAVSHCLYGCYAADNPLVAVAEYVARLRNDPDWTEEEILMVESNAVRILTAILAPQQPG